MSRLMYINMTYLGVGRVTLRLYFLWRQIRLTAGQTQVADSNANHMSS